MDPEIVVPGRIVDRYLTPRIQVPDRPGRHTHLSREEGAGRLQSQMRASTVGG